MAPGDTTVAEAPGAGDTPAAVAPFGVGDADAGAEPFPAADGPGVAGGFGLGVPAADAAVPVAAGGDMAAGGLAAVGSTGVGAVMKLDGGAFSDRIAGGVAGAADVFEGEAVAGAPDGRAERESGSVAVGTGGDGTADAADLSAVGSGGGVCASASPAKNNGASPAGLARSSAVNITSERDKVEPKWLHAVRAKPPVGQRRSDQPSTMTRTRRLTPSSGFFGSASSVEPLPTAFSLTDGIECFVARKFLTDCARRVDSSLL